MATDPTRILVPQVARVYIAPVGTVAPDGPTVIMPDGWEDVGLFTPDSLQWATDPSFEAIQSHQSLYPTRRFQSGDAATIQVDLQEWSALTFRSVYGGGTITKVTPSGGGAAYYRFTPPAIGGRDTIAACVEIGDGTKHWRRIVPRCEQAEGVTQAWNRTAESTLPLRLSILGGDIGAPWYDVNDHPAFEEVEDDIESFLAMAA